MNILGLDMKSAVLHFNPSNMRAASGSGWKLSQTYVYEKLLSDAFHLKGFLGRL